ncbi:MAG: TIGR02117 family protein [Pseudomonadota bacterium]
MRRLVKLAGLLLLLPVASLLAYIAIAYVLVLFPLNSRPSGTATTVEAYVLTNGVHTDLVFPLKTATIDWERYFPKKHFIAVPATAAYIAIGWGDRDFYLYTPEWKDLTVARAVGAITGQHASVLHVTYLSEEDLRRHAYRLSLGEENYRALISYVLASAATIDQQLLPVANAHYSPQDAFYEAHGTYSLFNTCNTWAGTGLQRAGARVGWWTPFDTLVTWHLPQYQAGQAGQAVAGPERPKPAGALPP